MCFMWFMWFMWILWWKQVQRQRMEGKTGGSAPLVISSSGVTGVAFKDFENALFHYRHALTVSSLLKPMTNASGGDAPIAHPALVAYDQCPGTNRRLTLRSHPCAICLLAQSLCALLPRAFRASLGHSAAIAPPSRRHPAAIAPPSQVFGDGGQKSGDPFRAECYAGTTAAGARLRVVRGSRLRDLVR
jgi:hypothetical protein